MPCHVPGGGEGWDQAIIEYLREEFGLLVGPITAEELKLELGRAMGGSEDDLLLVAGRDLVTGVPRAQDVAGCDVTAALRGPIDEIARAVQATLEATPPELASDVVENGVVLVGGGISSAQAAVGLIAQGARVTILAPHAPREHQFDSDPGWLGPKYTDRFHREPDPDQRRAVISKARHRGSIPPNMARSIRRAIARDRIQWHEEEVKGFETHGAGLKATVGADTVLEVDRVLLATGFATRRPGGSMVDGLIESASLPCARCGYPIVDASLRWHPGIYVSGPLAELELGPVSRNIAGARRAGDRLVAAALSTAGATAP